MKKFNHIDVQNMLDNMYVKSIPMYLVENITIEYHSGKIKTVSRDQIRFYLPKIFATMLLNVENLDVSPDIRNVVIKMDTKWMAEYLNGIFERLSIEMKKTP